MEAKDGDMEVRQEAFLSRNQKNSLNGTEYRGGRVAFDFVSSSGKATIQIGYSFNWSVNTHWATAASCVLERMNSNQNLTRMVSPGYSCSGHTSDFRVIPLPLCQCPHCHYEDNFS